MLLIITKIIPFGRPILAIFIHRLFKDFAQIFELADLIFKEKS